MFSNSKFLRGYVKFTFNHIKRVSQALNIPAPAGKGFGCSKTKLVGNYVSFVKDMHSALGEQVTCRALGNDTYVFEHKVRGGITQVGENLFRHVSLKTGRIRYATTPKALPGEVEEEPMPEQPPLVEATEAAVVAPPTAPVVVPVGEIQRPAEDAELPSGTVSTQNLLRMIPETGFTRELRNPSLIPTSPPSSINYQRVEADAAGRLASVKVMTHICRYNPNNDPVTFITDHLLVSDEVTGRQRGASIDEYAAQNNLPDIPGEILVDENLRSTNQGGVDVSSITSCQQTALEEALTSTRVTERAWHKRFISLPTYNLVPGQTYDAPAISNLVIEAAPEGFNLAGVAKSTKTGVLGIEVALAIFLGVYFPASFPNIVKAVSTDLRLTEPVKVEGKEVSRNTPAFDSMCNTLRAELGTYISLGTTSLSGAPYMVSLRALLSFSRMQASQPDRYNYGVPSEEMLPVRALCALYNKVNASVTSFIQANLQLTGTQQQALVSLVEEARVSLRYSFHLVSISLLSVDDLPNNLAMVIAQEKSKLSSATLRAQAVRRFMLAFRALLLFLSATKIDVFNDIVRK